MSRRRTAGPRSFASSPWLRAPIALVRYRGLLLAVGSALLVLAIASGASPLFLSSAGNASLSREIAANCPWDVGLQVTISAPLAGETAFGDPAKQHYQALDREVRLAGESIPNTGPTEEMVLGQSTSIARAGGDFGLTTVRLLARDQALEHVTKLEGGDGPGVWLPDRTAAELGVHPGDEIALGSAHQPVTAPVAGIYRDLSTEPRASFWCAQDRLIFPLSAFANFTPPPLVLADRDLFLDLGEKLGEPGALFTWEFPVLAQGLTVPEAARTGARFDGARDALREQLVRVTVFPQTRTRLAFLAQHAAATVASLRGSIDTISLAGRIVALLVVAGAGIFWMHRRRLEVGLLSARGAGPISIGTKVLLEALPVAILAAGLGWHAAAWLVKTLGPGRLLDADAPSSALKQVEWTLALALLVLGLVVAVAAKREADAGRSRARETLARAPWEVAALLLAGASLYEILTRGPARVTDVNAPTKPDLLALLFPILFVAGASGLATRALRRLLPQMRSAGSGWSHPFYLASRRLAAAPRIALGLLTATALAIGMLMYAGTLTASIETTATAKAFVFVGSDLAVDLRTAPPVPADLPFPTTKVTRVGNATLVGTDSRVDVLGVDPGTFAAVAFWDPAFAGPSLPSLLGDLAPAAGDATGGIPVLSVGGVFPSTGTIAIGGVKGTLVPYRIVDTVRSFPGLHADLPMLVAERDALLGREATGTEMLWAKGDPAQILAAVRDSGAMIPGSEVMAREVRDNPDFSSLSWTFGFLQALGVLTGLIALGGMLLYLEARQRAREVSYALARRMGLSRRAHRRSVALELSAMLGAGFVLGAVLAWVGARLVYAELDPLPHLPPSPLFRTPLFVLFATGFAVLTASFVGAWRVQRAADRANVAEVMRLAG